MEISYRGYTIMIGKRDSGYYYSATGPTRKLFGDGILRREDALLQAKSAIDSAHPTAEINLMVENSFIYGE